MARPKHQPWKGSDANERAYNTVHNALVGIILDGVTGVSSAIPGHEWRTISPEKADEYLDRARRVLADFESQNPAPGGQRGRGQFWMENKIRELRRLLTDAEAVRSGAKPQKQTPESYADLRKQLGVHETRRRSGSPSAPSTPPNHDAPPRSFTSASGRTFTLGPPEALPSRVGNENQSWPILYNGEAAGKLFHSGNYGPNLPWHATTRELFWKYASDAPTGVGFDVAAFATAQQALDAWGRSADQILDWAEGKPVHTGYGHGPSQRTTRETRYPKLQPKRHFVSPRVADFNTLDALIDHARTDLGATHVTVAGPDTRIYFPRGGQYPYEEARVWRKGGYWHAEGPGARQGVRQLPRGAKPIGGEGAARHRAAEAKPGLHARESVAKRFRVGS